MRTQNLFMRARAINYDRSHTISYALKWVSLLNDELHWLLASDGHETHLLLLQLPRHTYYIHRKWIFSIFFFSTFFNCIAEPVSFHWFFFSFKASTMQNMIIVNETCLLFGVCKYFCFCVWFRKIKIVQNLCGNYLKLLTEFYGHLMYFWAKKGV